MSFFMENENYIKRPTTRPNETVKGKMRKWDNGYLEFVPQGTKESQRKMLKHFGDSSFYKNEGKKESSYSLHLNVDGKSPDPVAEMFELFKTLTADQQKQKPEMPDTTNGRMLYDDGTGNLKIWLDNSGKLSILATLECNSNIQQHLINAQGTMNVTLGRYREEIINNVQPTKSK